MRLDAHTVYDINEDGEDTDRVLAEVRPASNESVATVLSADENSEDGRSGWMWVRLANGDLILGVYPQGSTYFATEDDHS